MISGQQLGGFSLSDILGYNQYLDSIKTRSIGENIFYALASVFVQMTAYIISEGKVKICIWDKLENGALQKRKKIHNILLDTLPINIHVEVEYMGEN